MKIRSALTICVAVIAMLTACKKSYDLPPETLPTAYLNVVNGTADTLNFYLNGTRQNNTSPVYPAGASGYTQVSARAQNYQFKRNLQPAVLFSAPQTLKEGSRYSLFVGGEAADKTFITLDTISNIKSDSTTVRFAHTSENAPALDAMLDAVNGFKSQTFKNVTKFRNFAPGLKTINIYQAGGAAVKASLKVTLNPATAYTIYIKGVPDGTGRSAMSVGIFTH